MQKDKKQSLPKDEGLVSAGEELIREGKTLTKTDTSYQTAIAVQKPREIDKVVDNVLNEAKRAGARFYYGWDVKLKTGGKKHIEGGSIGLATCIARNYGNCAIPTKVEKTDDDWIFTACFIDFETGYNYMRTFVMPLNAEIGGGKYDPERSQIMAFQKAQSQAIRNVILNGGVPKWLVEEAIEIAKTGEIKKIKKEGTSSSKQKIIEFFSRYSITEKQLIQYIGKEIKKWDEQDIAQLRGVAESIKDGMVSPQEAFPPEKKDNPEKKQAAEQVNNLVGE